VFATSRDKVVHVGDVKESKTKEKVGEVFGSQGMYDLFPENTGSYTVSTKLNLTLEFLSPLPLVM
jgi:hypothetical protein